MVSFKIKRGQGKHRRGEGDYESYQASYVYKAKEVTGSYYRRNAPIVLFCLERDP